MMLTPQVLANNVQLLPRIKEDLRRNPEPLNVLYDAYKIWIENKNINALKEMAKLELFDHFSNNLIKVPNHDVDPDIVSLFKEYEVLPIEKDKDKIEEKIDC